MSTEPTASHRRVVWRPPRRQNGAMLHITLPETAAA
jgi:hypothetical protein